MTSVEISRLGRAWDEDDIEQLAKYTPKQILLALAFRKEIRKRVAKTVYFITRR